MLKKLMMTAAAGLLALSAVACDDDDPADELEDAGDEMEDTIDDLTDE